MTVQLLLRLRALLTRAKQLRCWLWLLALLTRANGLRGERLLRLRAFLTRADGLA